MTVRILPCGDGGLTIELGRDIDAGTNARIIALADHLDADPVTGILECIPTYRSLTVLYDPDRISRHAVATTLLERLDAPAPATAGGRTFSVPVRYGGPVGQDLETVAEMKAMTVEELIGLHSGVTYRVYTIGFAPGFAYLGGLPEPLHTPRLAEPRQRVQAGAIGIGGKQASINSLPGPSGWRFLGQTPVRLFDPSRADPFLLRAGDAVRFRPISGREEQDIRRAIAAGATTGMEELSP